MNEPSPQAMKNLHELLARILPKYHEELSVRAEQKRLALSAEEAKGA